jgi:hypothetical protein
MRLLLITLLILLPVNVLAKNLYVDGSDAGCSDSTTYANNDADNPWCTIGRAAWGNASRASASSAQAAAAGDIVYVAAGVYITSSSGTSDRWNIALNPANSGSDGSPITFIGVGTVEIRRDSASNGGPTIGSNSRTYIIWDNFIVDDYYQASVGDVGPVLLAGAAGSQILNCTITGHGGSYYHGQATFVDNYNGIRLENTSYNTIKNNSIGGFPSGQNQAAIMTYGSKHILIENNHIYSAGCGVYLKGNHGSVGDTDYNIVRYNLIEDCQIGISHGYSARYGKTYQNILSGNDTGILIRDLGTDELTVLGSYIVNNTLVNNTGHFQVLVNEGQDITIANNITSGGATVYDSWFGPDLDDNTYNRNNQYNYSSHYGYMASGNYTIASWRSTFGYDMDSITSDPLFTDAANEDFTLQTGSPALTLGRTITAIHGSSGSTIPAGAYITGNEVIGIDTGEPVLVNGACGSNDGATLSSLTSGNTNNCSAGTVADFSGTGPWTWNCDGANGGTDDSCSASLASPVAGALRQGAFRIGGLPARFVESTP